jgi:hypothetical protein
VYIRHAKRYELVSSSISQVKNRLLASVPQELCAIASSTKNDNDRHSSQSVYGALITGRSKCISSWMESGVLKPRQLGLCGRTFGRTMKPRQAEVTGPARYLRADWPMLCTIRTLGLRFLAWRSPSYMSIVRYAGLFPRIFGRLLFRTQSVFGVLYASTCELRALGCREQDVQ